MSAYLYDEALTAKIKNWTENSDIHIYGPDQSRRLIETLTDENNDKPIQLPIISISRVGGYEILNPNKYRPTYDGLMYDATKEKSVQLNFIPINISYQIDVWTRYFKEADSFIRNLVFNIINFPMLQVIIPYNDWSIPHNSAIRLTTGVMDTSDDNRLSIGQFSRLAVGVSIDDAYIWDTRIRDNILIDYEFDESNL